MTYSEDKPPPAVGAYWIKEEDYPALLQLFEDGDKMPPSWKEWLKMAEEMERGLKAYGHVVLRVYIDPATFPDWCVAHSTRTDRHSSAPDDRCREVDEAGEV
jgi:hypothetical protein